MWRRALPTLILRVTEKTSFFVYNQAKIDYLANEKNKELKSEVSKIEDENQVLSGDLKACSAGKARSCESARNRAHIRHRTSQDQGNSHLRRD
jgi:hypothetical protein